MKTSKQPPDRILFVFGQGLPAWQGCDLLFLFSHAGFRTYAAVNGAGLGWVPADVLLQLSGHQVFSPPDTPGWVNRPEDFKLAIGIGLPPDSLNEIAEKNTKNPLLELMLKKSRETIFFLDAGTTIPDATLDALEKSSLGIRLIPGEIGKMRAAFEKGFSSIIASFRRKAIFRNLSAQFRPAGPENDSGPAREISKWRHELEQKIFSSGFSSVKDDSPPDLLIETWNGAGPVKRSRKRKSESPESTQNPGGKIGKSLKIRFVDSTAKGYPFLKDVGDDSWLLIREPEGDLLLSDQNGTRHIPNLSARPAFEKLLDILAMTFSLQRPVKID